MDTYARSNAMNPDIGRRPIPCTGALRRVDGQFCTVLTTDWEQPDLSLAQMKKIIDPHNWPKLCDFFVRMTTRRKLTPDTSRGWSRVLETVSGDATQWQMRTALRYWKGLTTPDDGIYINYDLDHPRTGDDNVVEVDSGYICITPIAQGNPAAGVRIRTSKAVRIRGLSATATAAVGCFFGWGDAASQMLVDQTKNPPHGCRDFGKPSVATDAVILTGKTSGKGAGSPAEQATKEILAAAAAVGLPDKWRGAMIANTAKEANATIDVLAPLATDWLTRWSEGVSEDDIKEFGERAGRTLTDRAVAMFGAAAVAVRPPSGTNADGGDNP